MLRELSVKDFAIIDSLRLDFKAGLNILTGETGAGKSILVDALGMALGDRVRGEQVRTGAEETRVEAVFTGCGGAWEGYLRERGITPDAEGELFIQRRLTSGGRHQAYINGASVPPAVLAEAGARLVDIHGQHQHQSLLRVANQIEILDDYGGLAGRRREFADLWKRLTEIRRKMEKAAEAREARESRRDFLAFQARELESAGLSPGEDVELERERAMMQNAERIHQLIAECLDLLYEGERAAAGQVESATQRASELSRHLPQVASLAAGLEGCGAVIREAAGGLKEWLDRAEYDPERHQEIEERLALLARLKRKYGSTAEEMLKKLESLRVELGELEASDNLLEEWGREREEVLAAMADAGRLLSRGREKTARQIEKEVAANLAELGMPRARFAVSLSPRRDPNGPLTVEGERYDPWEGGLEEAEFLFSANPGEDPKSLARVASGGELSRIMLAVKGSLARVDRVATLIFDEIDAGIGGAAARVVGRRLKGLSAQRQVICVTHLPQIASLADEHILVAKRVVKGKTRVEARVIGEEERIGEIARMIAGETVTPSAVQHARQLMEG